MQTVDDELPPMAVPPNFPNYEAFDAWRLECQRMAESFGPPSKFKVAPGVEFPADPELAGPGVILRAGDEVRPFDHYLPSAIAGLVRRGAVVQGTVEGELVALCPSDARYVLARSVIVASGAILPPGAEMHAFLLRNGQKDLDRLIAAGIVIDRSPQPSEGATPADRAVGDALKLLATAEADVTRAQEHWLDEESPAATKALRAARDAVELAELRVTRARRQKAAAEVAEKVAHRARLESELEALDAEKKKAAAARAEKTKGVREAAIGLARAIADDSRAANEECSVHDQWRARYAELSGVSADRIYGSMPMMPDLPRLFSALVDATGGSVAAHELFAEVEK
jgi:hypothetical protein